MLTGKSIDAPPGPRCDVTKPFGAPLKLANVNSGMLERAAWLMPDEKTLYVADSGFSHDPSVPHHIRAFSVSADAKLSKGRVFCDEWEQARHGGELTGAVAAGVVRREDVVELGAVCAGLAPGRGSRGEITLFDSTGLAIQDLAIALGALEALRVGAVKPQTVSL